MRFSWIVCLMLSTGSVCSPIAVSQTPYHVLPGKADADGCLPTTAARLCLGATGTEHCYAPPSTKDYIFGLEPKARPVSKIDGRELTLFTADFDGCGSGTLTDFSLLTVRNGEFVNLLPSVRLTNVSEHRLWSLSQFSNLPILVTADFIWDMDAGETHFSRHRYWVSAYVFNPESRQYLQRVHFATNRKFSGGDVDPIRVLEAEKPTILAQLRQPPLK